MSRFILPAALCALLLAPNTALSQKAPEKTKELRDAERFIASAMMTGDTIERKSRLMRALNPLQEAITKSPSNARVWLTAGQVYAGLGDALRADSAFTKAVQLYPGFEEEVASERLTAWANTFTAGAALMEAQEYDLAIEQFENAEILLATRPESKMNLAFLYLNKNDIARAEAMFRGAAAATTPGLRAKASAEDAAQWLRLNEMATINIARMVGERGIVAFDADRYDEAIAAFSEAQKVNPHARDFSYNLAQAIYAKARVLENQHADLIDEEKAARAKKDNATAMAKAQEARRIADLLDENYAAVEPLVEATRKVDPNNEGIFQLLVRSYQVRANLATDPAKKAMYQKRSAELVNQHSALDADVTGIMVSVNPPAGEATVKGSVRNLKLNPGTPAKVRVTLIGIDGVTVGEQEVGITTPKVDENADFEVTMKVNGEIAGWKYELVK